MQMLSIKLDILTASDKTWSDIWNWCQDVRFVFSVVKEMSWTPSDQLSIKIIFAEITWSFNMFQHVIPDYSVQSEAGDT